ncbi:MAG TPA: hypothetical protein VFX30_00180 [bacterium]|nr:hypothetical protein [bacterium]
MIFMTISPLFGGSLTNQTAYDNALNTVRGIIFEATSNDKALSAAASATLAEFGDSGTLPNVINGLCNVSGFTLDEVKARKVETLGQAAQLIIDRG